MQNFGEKCVLQSSCTWAVNKLEEKPERGRHARASDYDFYCTVIATGPRVVVNPDESEAMAVIECGPTVSVEALITSDHPEFSQVGLPK